MNSQVARGKSTLPTVYLGSLHYAKHHHLAALVKPLIVPSPGDHKFKTEVLQVQLFTISPQVADNIFSLWPYVVIF